MKAVLLSAVLILAGGSLFTAAVMGRPALQCHQAWNDAFMALADSPDMTPSDREQLLEAPKNSVACQKTESFAHLLGY